MLGKTFRKVSNWLGKSHNFLEKSNNWIGKALSSVKNEYRTIKRDLINDSGVFRPLVRELFVDIETNPISNIVEDVFQQAQLRNQQMGDLLHVSKSVYNTGDKIGKILTSGSKGGGNKNKSNNTRISRFITS